MPLDGGIPERWHVGRKPVQQQLELNLITRYSEPHRSYLHHLAVAAVIDVADDPSPACGLLREHRDAARDPGRPGQQ